jgi:AmiR/NasT family two-component response regulator
MAPATILIVEDEVSEAMELQGRLNAMGYQVVGIAPSGEQAIETAGRAKPDLVLMDVALPGEVDGLEAARTIGDRFGIPVIFVTACADDEFLERAKWTYPLAYIVTPCSERQLRAAIEIGLFKYEQDARFRRSSELFAMTLDILGGAAIVTDENGVIQNMSSVAETLTGWAYCEAVGKHISEVYVLRDEESGRSWRIHFLSCT